MFQHVKRVYTYILCGPYGPVMEKIAMNGSTGLKILKRGENIFIPLAVTSLPWTGNKGESKLCGSARSEIINRTVNKSTRREG